MGLLEDAIREHLALKRQHGADPGEVTAQEREALGPIQRGVEPLVLDREPAPEEAPAAHDEPVEDLPEAAEPDLVPEYEPPPASPLTPPPPRPRRPPTPRRRSTSRTSPSPPSRRPSRRHRRRTRTSWRRRRTSCRRRPSTTASGSSRSRRATSTSTAEPTLHRSRRLHRHGAAGQRAGRGARRRRPLRRGHAAHGARDAAVGDRLRAVARRRGRELPQPDLHHRDRTAIRGPSLARGSGGGRAT